MRLLVLISEKLFKNDALTDAEGFVRLRDSAFPSIWMCPSANDSNTFSFFWDLEAPLLSRLPTVPEYPLWALLPLTLDKSLLSPAELDIGAPDGITRLLFLLKRVLRFVECDLRDPTDGAAMCSEVLGACGTAFP